MRASTRRCLAALAVLGLVFVPGAAASWGGTDPPGNIPLPWYELPSSCNSAPTGADCENAVIYHLDRARRSTYKLPADFLSLTPADQMFILTDLDRVANGMKPIPGLNDALNNDADTKGVEADSDPYPGGATLGFTANWAGYYYNAPLAYYAWMYDDGLNADGSAGPNGDCAPGNRRGCWGHRHDILWDFGSNVTAMGAAAGTDPKGRPGYAMLIAAYGSGSNPSYSYTWSQAVAEGAGTNNYDPGTPKVVICVVPRLRGKSLAAAKLVLTRAHCQLGKIARRHSLVKRGRVIAQKPRPGSELQLGAKVALVLSSGRARRR